MPATEGPARHDQSAESPRPVGACIPVARNGNWSLDNTRYMPDDANVSHLLSYSITDRPGVIFVLAAAVTFYLAGKFAADALTVGGRSPTALRIAIAHFLPIAFVAIIAALAGNAFVAVGVVFATAVGALSLNLGVSVCSADHPEAPPSTARAWAFLLPVTVMVFMAGFSASLTPMTAILLLAQGVFVIVVWTGRHEVASVGDEMPEPKLSIPSPRLAQLAVAIVLCIASGWLALNVSKHIGMETGIMSPGLIAAAVLSPLLMLPMFGTSSHLSQRGYSRASIEASIVLVLLNLCLLLPLCVAAWNARTILHPWFARLADPTIAEFASAQTITTTAPSVETTLDSLYYPLVVWRLDTVILIVLSLMLLPTALGRWTIGRKEGFFLVVGYAFYLMFTTRFGARW